MKSEAAIAGMIRDNPAKADWWIEMEQKYGATFHKARSYQALADMVKNQGDVIFSTEGFLCQADDGECM